MMRIIVVSHALVQEAARARWRRLAERHPVDVTLLVPARWQSRWFGDLTTWQPQREEIEHYRVLPLPVSDTFNWGRYLFLSPDAHLRALKPDIIYVVQEETTFVLQQMILYRRLWAPRAKLLFFSWNNLCLSLQNWKVRLPWRNVCRAADVAIAGSSEVVQVLQKAGFVKPIKVQTEIGVDETQFCPEEQARDRVKAELGLKGFVIGFAGRLVVDKGVSDLVEAVLALPGDWSLMVVGDGVLRQKVEARFAECGLSDRLRLLGEQPIDVMPDYFRAMDCLVLPSRTMPGWKEQFGLVLAQAMACWVPVIGSSSGAIPEVIGEAGLIFPEGDVTALHNCLKRLMENESLREDLGRRGYERTMAKYSSAALADETYELFKGLIRDD